MEDVELYRPQAPPQRPARPAPADSDDDPHSRTYVVAEQAWRAEKGLSRRRKTTPPSRTPEARRRAHLQKLVNAGKFATVAEADTNTQRRQSFGRKRRDAGASVRHVVRSRDDRVLASPTAASH